MKKGVNDGGHYYVICEMKNNMFLIGRELRFLAVFTEL